MSKTPQIEPETPALDAFMQGAILRKLKPAERRKFFKQIWAQCREVEQRKTLDPELLPQRIMVMWRLTRCTAVIKGLCADDETLDAATEVHPDPWVTPFKPVMLPTGLASLRRQRAARLLQYHAEGKGLSLLPSRVSPDDIRRWCLAAALISKDLGIERSQQGLLGLQGLLDPEISNDVSSSEVIAFEELLLEESLDMLLDNGERACIKHLRDHIGLSRKEAMGLVRVCKVQALERSAGSVEEKRALQEARLEDFIGRSKDSMDMDGEMKGIKELAKIQGLTRSEPENQAAEFFAVIKKISSQQDTELLDAKSVALLNGHRVEEVAPRTIEAIPVDPDDAQALAEFDAENQLKP